MKIYCDSCNRFSEPILTCYGVIRLENCSECGEGYDEEDIWYAKLEYPPSMWHYFLP